LIEANLAEHLNVIVGADLRRHAHPQIAQRAEFVAGVVEKPGSSGAIVAVTSAPKTM
jgi:hypothetical protein